MKQIKTAKDFINHIKLNGKKGQVIIYDEATTNISNKRDKYDLSNGNLEVLKTIPEMMQFKEWRDKLRKIVFDYNRDKINKRSN